MVVKATINEPDRSRNHDLVQLASQQGAAPDAWERGEN